MVGGDDEPVQRLEPIFTALAPDDGYAHVGAERRRALREDGAQRHRVRAHAGVRGGLRGDGEVRVRPRPARHRRHLALRLGRALVAARAAVRRAREGGQRPAAYQGLRRRLRRGTLDDPRGDRRGRSRARHHRGALRPLRVAPGRVVRREDHRGAAQRVRRPRGEEPNDGHRRKTRCSKDFSCGARRTRARSSSSAPRATSRIASSSPRSTRSHTAACCRRSSRSSASRAAR